MASRGKVATCEEMEEFASNCKLKEDGTGRCTHKNKKVEHCIKDKKYCPRVSIRSAKQDDQPEWKTNYELFKADHDKFFNEVILSEKFVRPLELQFPNIDVRETLLIQSNWWSSDKPNKGFDNKRKSASKTIDWEQTYEFSFRRALYMKQAVKKSTSSYNW